MEMTIKQKTDVTILIPAYNEEENIGTLVQELKETYPNFEILVVDDGSTDKTMDIAIAAGANVWPHPYNIGNGAAIKTGLRCAVGEWILMMDADGQHKVEDIDRMLTLRKDYDMIVGARISGSEVTVHRTIANRLYNLLSSYLTQFKIEDLTSGFRLVKKSVVQKFIYLLPNSFSYPTTITMAYLRSGRSVKYIPITTRKRIGKSKIRLLQDGTRFLLIITRIATLFSPLRIFVPISLSCFLIGLCYYLYTFYFFHQFTNMSALLFSTSVIIFMIGLVSEQICQMRYDRAE